MPLALRRVADSITTMTEYVLPTHANALGGGRSMAVMADPGSAGAAPDCRTCGACCYGDEMWIHVMADDDERLDSARLHHLTVLTEHGRGYVARSMRMVGGRCIAYRDE